MAVPTFTNALFMGVSEDILKETIFFFGSILLH
jgi:hypothetical protein